jgi:large subunit ribosomal protein L24
VQKQLPVKKPGKQRKRLFNAPLHIRQKNMTAPLSPELRSSKGVKSLPVRKGDTIQIVRGDNIGFEGKINRLDLKRYRIFIEGLTREKVDGTNIFISVHPSKVVIKKLKLDDKWRKAIIERKKSPTKLDEEKKAKKETKQSAKKSSTKPKKDSNLATQTKQKKKNTDKKTNSSQKDKITTNKEMNSKKRKKTSKKKIKKN